MLHRIKILCISLLVCFMGLQTSWAQRQYNILFVDISEPAFEDGVEQIRELRSLPESSTTQTFQSQKCFVCKYNTEDLDSIGAIYISNLPAGIDKTLVLHAVVEQDEAALHRLQAVMQNHNQKLPKNNDFYKHYFSGLLAYRHMNGRIFLYTVLAKKGTPVFYTARNFVDEISLPELDELVRQIIKNNLLLWNESGFM